MTITLVHTRHYVRVQNLMGASFFGWFTPSEIAQFTNDRYSIEYQKASTGSRTAPSDCHDIIADMAVAIAHAQYGYSDESSTYTQVQADAAQYAMRDTLELMVEFMGGQLLLPPTPEIQSMFDQFMRRTVERMHNAAILQEYREAQA